jgi:hypothetical protein
MSKEVFHISDILGLYTGTVLSRQGYSGILDIYGHCVQNPEITHVGVLLAAGPVKQFLEVSLPWVLTYPYKKLGPLRGPTAVDDFVALAAKKHGAFHLIGQMRSPPDTSKEAELKYAKIMWPHTFAPSVRHNQ